MALELVRAAVRAALAWKVRRGGGTVDDRGRIVSLSRKTRALEGWNPGAVQTENRGDLGKGGGRGGGGRRRTLGMLRRA